ncbi:STAS domain-containing protein [Sporolactobacillus shoreicorticis]|uniref:Anti-sigma factor antagonist n=1 Tax=Sporolactobacillus shoreicorticis TaxID=1923877 RepID=A0ABW5S5Q8_9BACL|nr:STAS domain-containing protein [Sporolactobacillus shoreicorticis]MCO7128225.1 STAS domain-containing protein [Sporolactobacillus shoreicorticis]
MNISIEREAKGEKIYLVAVEGEIDVFTAPELKKGLLPLTEIEDGKLILDLNKTKYMDSTALGVIVAALKSAAKHNCRFSVIGMTPRIKRLFEITGLMDLLTRAQISGGSANA